MINDPKLVIWFVALVCWASGGSGGVLEARAETTTIRLDPRCKRVCRRIYHKRSTRHCERRWSCGPQYECRWLQYSRLDSDGYRRTYRKRECSYVHRCSYKQICRYTRWKLKCRIVCDGAVHREPTRHMGNRRMPPVAAMENHCGLRGQELLLWQQVNLARQLHKRRPLRCHPRLQKAARYWSQVQCFRGELSHSQLRERLREAGMSSRLYAENVAAGMKTAIYVFRRWMRSPRHRRHILHPRFTLYGGGLYLCGTSRYTHYWTQLFVGK